MSAREQIPLFAVVSCTWEGVDDVGRLCRDCSVDVIEIGESYMVIDDVWPVEQAAACSVSAASRHGLGVS